MTLSPQVNPTALSWRSVRISVTDRCDQRCIYCVPDSSSNEALRASERLSDDAILEVVRTLVSTGTRRVRLTGGEPLVRPRIVDLVARLAQLGLEDLALTTNGTLLSKLARPLADAGLKRLNVSLDSLEPKIYARITGIDALPRVLDGIDAAARCGFRDIGLNIVLLRGINDHEARRMVDYAWENGLVPRFIELMKVGGGSDLWPAALVTAEQTLAMLGDRVTGPLESASTAPGRGPARYREAADGSGRRVGFITGSSHAFCRNCDRLRLTSDGRLRPCLATSDAVDISGAARSGDHEAIARGVVAAWESKPDVETWRGCNEDSASDVDMTSTGG